MRAVVQRVKRACVDIDGKTISAIQKGLMVLLGIGDEDTAADADYIAQKLTELRIFEDADGKMNLSLSDVAGGLLLVSQFTLAADTQSGLRPSFSTAAPPALAETLFNHLLSEAKRLHPAVASGRFGADMQVHLVNDGPVTFMLQT